MKAEKQQQKKLKMRLSKLKLMLKPQLRQLPRLLSLIFPAPARTRVSSSSVLFSCDCHCLARAPGFEDALAELGVAESALSSVTGLLAGLAPVPGGIGVAEATMAGLLTAVGIPSEQAVAIAIIHRVMTAYLPPVLGFFSLRWLGREGYL